MTDDARLHAPAALRNRDLILEILRPVLPQTGLILEVASGSGQHCIRFAEGLPSHMIQPSDPDAKARASIDAWVESNGLTNVHKAIALDAAQPVWPLHAAAAIVCINMIHISPWGSAIGLFEGAARLLSPGAPLYLYGPYKQAGAHTAPSNAAFDADLRQQNPQWGVRDLEAVVELGVSLGFSEPAVTPMPANNLSLVFVRRT
jgi:hypothetical protein